MNERIGAFLLARISLDSLAKGFNFIRKLERCQLKMSKIIYELVIL
jgi:hypothetical protein